MEISPEIKDFIKKNCKKNMKAKEFSFRSD